MHEVQDAMIGDREVARVIWQLEGLAIQCNIMPAPATTPHIKGHTLEVSEDSSVVGFCQVEVVASCRVPWIKHRRAAIVKRA